MTIFQASVSSVRLPDIAFFFFFNFLKLTFPLTYSKWALVFFSTWSGGGVFYIISPFDTV